MPRKPPLPDTIHFPVNAQGETITLQPHHMLQALGEERIFSWSKMEALAQLFQRKIMCSKSDVTEPIVHPYMPRATLSLFHDELGDTFGKAFDTAHRQEMAFKIRRLNPILVVASQGIWKLETARQSVSVYDTRIISVTLATVGGTVVMPLGKRGQIPNGAFAYAILKRISESAQKGLSVDDIEISNAALSTSMARCNKLMGEQGVALNRFADRIYLISHHSRTGHDFYEKLKYVSQTYQGKLKFVHTMSKPGAVRPK